MRSTIAAAVAVVLVTLPIGCGGKGSPTSAPETRAPEPAQPTPPGPAPGGTPPEPGSARTGDGKEKVKVEIAKGALVINGTPVPLPGELPAFEKGLGKPSDARETGVGLYRGIYWKSLGIKALQETSGQQRIVTIYIHLEAHDDALDDAKYDAFPGVIILEGQRIAKDTDMAEVGKKVSGLKEALISKWELKYPDSASVYIDTTIKVGPKGPLKGVRQVTVERLK